MWYCNNSWALCSVVETTEHQMDGLWLYNACSEMSCRWHKTNIKLRLSELCGDENQISFDWVKKRREKEELKTFQQHAQGHHLSLA